MYFIDKKHKEFYEDTLKQIENIRKINTFDRSLIYTLGISQITRKHINEIFDFAREEIQIGAINKSWQTRDSKKVTELAFNLWNDFKYDTLENMEKDKISTDYIISNIFCSPYAPYFYEAIKLRFPEYAKSLEEEEDM